MEKHCFRVVVYETTGNRLHITADKYGIPAAITQLVVLKMTAHSSSTSIGKISVLISGRQLVHV